MSFKKELDLEERLNKISSKAVREPDVEDRTTLRQIQTSTEKNDINDIRQLQIEAQIAKISSNAIVDILGIKPSKIKTFVTKEMILDYQNEMNKPIEIGGIKYKYHPSSVDLDELEYVPIHYVLNPIQIVALKLAITKISNETIPRLQAELDYYAVYEVNQLRERFDGEIGRIESETFYTTTRAKKTEAKRIVVAEFEDLMKRNNAIQLDLRSRIEDEEAKIAGIQNRIDMNERNKKENRAEQVRIQKENSARLKVYEEDLNLLNRGRMNITREPNETDEDYRFRLLQTGQMTISEDAIAESAILYNRDKLREHALELVRDTGIISNALKFLSDDQVFKINQNWSRIKRDFIKVYGFDNKSIKEEDLIAFFEQGVDPIIDAVNKGKAPPVDDLLGATPEPLTAEAIPLKGFDELSGLNMNELKAYYQQYKPVPPKYPKARVDMIRLIQEANLILDREITGQPRGSPPSRTTISSIFAPVSPALGSSLAKRVYSLDELKVLTFDFLDKVRSSEEKISRETASVDIRDKADELVRLINATELAGDKDSFYILLDEIEKYKPNLIKDRFPEFYPRLIGSGLKPITHDIPNLIEFGKVKISPRKLYYNNILAIKHKSGHSLAGLPNVQVSEKFVAIIMNLLKGQKPSLKDFTQLDLNEKGIYDTLIQLSGLHKDVDNNFGETKQHLKNRLELVEGEIGAGNTNPSLKKELRSLLGKMAHTGMIGYGDAKKHYLSVCGGV